MVQNNKRKEIKKSTINGGGSVTVLIATYKKPEILKKCLSSLISNAGTGFHLWIWNNSNENIGLNAYAEMGEEVETDHVVTVDDDVIQFPKNWLINQLNAFYDVPPTFKKKAYKYSYWGWLGLMPIKDKFTNGAIWPDFLKDTKVVKGKRWKFRIGRLIPQTCAMIHRDTLRKIDGFPYERRSIFYPLDGETGLKIHKLGMAQALIENLNIYHACGPYYNRAYKEIWQAKTGQTIEESEKEYQKLDKSLKFQ